MTNTRLLFSFSRPLQIHPDVMLSHPHNIHRRQLLVIIWNSVVNVELNVYEIYVYECILNAVWCQVECIGWSRDRWRNFSPFQEQQIFSNEILKICWNSRALAFIRTLLSSSKFHMHCISWWPWWLWQPLAVFSVTIFLRCVISYWILISWWASPKNWPKQVF